MADCSYICVVRCVYVCVWVVDLYCILPDNEGVFAMFHSTDWNPLCTQFMPAP